jgi:hypothetical protein
MMLVLATAPGAANAYALTGCKWGSNTINIKHGATAQYAQPLSNAITNWEVVTDMEFTLASSAAFTTSNSFEGATGFAGYATWTCLFGTTTSAHSRINEWYAQSYSAGAVKTLWLHERGHSLGLSHVSPVARVMHPTPIAAYNAGVLSPTSDDIAGINSLY